jgi:hypothetical protein
MMTLRAWNDLLPTLWLMVLSFKGFEILFQVAAFAHMKAMNIYKGPERRAFAREPKTFNSWFNSIRNPFAARVREFAWDEKSGRQPV